MASWRMRNSRGHWIAPPLFRLSPLRQNSTHSSPARARGRGEALEVPADRTEVRLHARRIAPAELARYQPASALKLERMSS